MSSLRALPGVALALAFVVTAVGCASPVTGRAMPGDGVVRGDPDTGVLRGAGGGSIDELAAATVIDVQEYWRDNFGATFDEDWADVDGGFYSVDTADLDSAPPPCVDEAAEVEGNAFYCPSADAIAWDRSALLPVLRERHGDAGVVVVIAHEVGHAVHTRLGIDSQAQRNQPNRYPTILIEAMADCYAGVFVRSVTDGDAEHLRIVQRQLDSALGALVTFRDPVGTSAADSGAHGNAFDRVSSFQDGYERGPQTCADFSMQNRVFTQSQFTNAEDQQRGGNLPYDQLLESILPDLDRYFGELVRSRGEQWDSMEIRDSERTPGCSGDQGPAAYCPGGDGIQLGSTELDRVHTELGDYATGTLVATRFALAALDDLGRPTSGEQARRSAVCLAGTYTGQLLARTDGFGLSPGDLDEAVQVLLSYDYGSRDTEGAGLGLGFDRVGSFRTGTLDGVDGCELG